jgi:holliday junction DNA helicase RuvA
VRHPSIRGNFSGVRVECLTPNDELRYDSRPMIASLTGELSHVDTDRIFLRVDAIQYELLVPAADVAELNAQLGETITFHTILYLEGDPNRGNLEPRLIGFVRPTDKKFFLRFTTVKGIGAKTALRALTIPVGEIAKAIETKDSKFLQQLDGVGKRTAELIVAELSGRVAEFAGEHVKPTGTRGSAILSSEDEIAIEFAMSPRLGFRRADAERLLSRAKASRPDLKAAKDLLPEMLRLHGATE